MTFTASLRSELLKTKRTSSIYLPLVAAAITPLVFAFDILTSDSVTAKDSWGNFYLEGLMVMVFAFLPLFFVLASTLLVQIEVRNNTWKQVLASPQLFFDVLLAKYVVLQLLGLAFIVAFNIYYIIGASLVDVVLGSNFIGYLERWPELISINLRAYCSTVGLSALCFWLAVRSKNFVAPVGVGFVLWIGTIVALEFHWPNIDKYVFGLPFTVISKKFKDEQLFHQLLSVAYGLVFFIGAYLEFSWKKLSVGRSLKSLVSGRRTRLGAQKAEHVSQ
jgi:hypothetical protein